MSNSKLHQAANDAKAEIIRSIDDFEASLSAQGAEGNPLMSFFEIEKKWSDLKRRTTNSYSDMVSAYLSDLSEADIIKSKKAIMPGRG